MPARSAPTKLARRRIPGGGGGVRFAQLAASKIITIAIIIILMMASRPHYCPIADRAQQCPSEPTTLYKSYSIERPSLARSQLAKIDQARQRWRCRCKEASKLGDPSEPNSPRAATKFSGRAGRLLLLLLSLDRPLSWLAAVDSIQQQQLNSTRLDSVQFGSIRARLVFVCGAAT